MKLRLKSNLHEQARKTIYLGNVLLMGSKNPADADISDATGRRECHALAIIGLGGFNVIRIVHHILARSQRQNRSIGVGTLHTGWAFCFEVPVVKGGSLFIEAECSWSAMMNR